MADTLAKHNGALAELQYGGVKIGNRVDMTISTSVNEIDSNDADTGVVTEALVGRKTITISGSANLDLTDAGQIDIFEALLGLQAAAATGQDGTDTFTWYYKDLAGETQWAASGFFTQFDTNSPDETTATASFTIRIISAPTPTVQI